MKSGPLEMNLLYDFYGDMLTDRQREVFSLYYGEDFSLAEIAESTGITRQGVRDCVKRAEHTLRGMEEKFGLLRRFRAAELCAERFRRELNNLTALNAADLHSPELAASIGRLSQLVAQLQSGGTYGI